MDVAKEEKQEDQFVLFDTAVKIGERNWQFPNPVAGGRTAHTNLKWDFDLPDGSTLLSPKNAQLLRDSCIFIVTKVLEPQASDYPRVSTVIGHARGLRQVLRWMQVRGIQSFGEISSTKSFDFAEFCVDSCIDKSESEDSALAQDLMSDEALPAEDLIGGEESTRKANFQTPWMGINALITLFQQRDAMRGHGASVVAEAPFDGRSANNVLEQDFGISKDGRLSPIPDDVAIPLLNAAVRMLDAPAMDIKRLQDIYTDVLAMPAGAERHERYLNNIQEFRDFQFSCIDGEGEPWRAPIRPYVRIYRDGREKLVVESQAVRRLIMDLQTACAIVVQATTGIRASELLGTEVAPEHNEEGLPSCIETDTMRDGTMTRYFLRSRTAKGEVRDEKWLLGARVIESTQVPVAVKAIQTIFALNAPWRELSGLKCLFITFKVAKGLPRTKESVGRMLTDVMSNRQKDFIYENVDLTRSSLDSKEKYVDGKHLRPHQWRPTFAMFVMRTNPRLIPALSDHFKHINAVVTMEGYIGLNPELRDAMDSARHMASTLSMIRMVDAESSLAGGGAVTFRKLAPKLMEMMRSQPGESVDEKWLSLVQEQELYIYDAAHGYCLSALAPSKSRCRSFAGYAGPLRPYPHDHYRSVPVCSQCPLLVMTREHLEFHEQRLERNRKDLANIARETQPGMFKILSARVRQSTTVTQKLGDKIDG